MFIGLVCGFCVLGLWVCVREVAGILGGERLESLFGYIETGRIY